jgi:hypothetical protein
MHAQTTRRGFTGQRTITADRAGDEHLVNHATELSIAVLVSEKLEQHYPAHPWMVKVDMKQGIVQVSLPLVMPKTEVYVIHIDKLKMDPALKCVVRAGGTILEKYNIPRSGFRLDTFLEARDRGHIGQAQRRNAARRILLSEHEHKPGQLLVPRQYARNLPPQPRPRIVVNA